MLALPMINTVKLISVTTLFVTTFIATALLIYGASGASACPQGWTRDAYGNCSIRAGKHKLDASTSHATPVSAHDDNPAHDIASWAAGFKNSTVFPNGSWT